MVQQKIDSRRSDAMQGKGGERKVFKGQRTRRGKEGSQCELSEHRDDIKFARGSQGGSGTFGSRPTTQDGALKGSH